ncbi:MAG: hypothetical protein AAGU76_05020 [Sedimentibacter sp.]|uniref:hypothetical protein n=1 Tax=Sedimentibacter sp. TaxID=1960295 RepID=UPI003158029E
MSNYLKEEMFPVERYIEITDFERLFDDSISGGNGRFLAASLAGCIEGNIQLCVTKKIWSAWLGYNEICCEPINGKPRYTFLSIYNFVKSNKCFFDFLVRYFNLWHGKEFSEFTYDSYHIGELKENYKHLVRMINHDLEQAVKNKDQEVLERYRIIISHINFVLMKTRKCLPDFY